MFKYLTNFSYKRNWKEAIGFYLVFFLVGIILGLVMAVFFILSSKETVEIFSRGFYRGITIINVLSVIYCLVIFGFLLKEKKLFKNFGYLLLALLSGVLAVLGGVSLGLIIPAVLTTKQKKE